MVESIMNTPPRKRIEMIEMLDEGGNGVVWIARLFETPDDTDFKIVVVKVQQDADSDSLEREFEVMKNIGRHKNIINYIELGKDFIAQPPVIEGIFYLALEYASNKTLCDYLNSMEGYLDEKWVRYWFCQIFEGL
jgi:serine/threonine protein kinase